MRSISRRRFLGSALAAGAGLAAGGGVLAGLTGCAGGGPTPTSIPRLNGGRRVFADLHLHGSLYSWLEHSPMAVKNPALLRGVKAEYGRARFTWSGLHAQGVDLVCAVHFNPFDEWVSMPTDPSPEARENTLRMMRLLEEELAGDAGRFARLVRNREQLDECLAVRTNDPNFRVAVVHALEGGHVLGGEPASLEEFARLGVAMITVTHFFNKGAASAANSFPFFADAETIPTRRGLSELGREIVAEMNRLGIIVDVSHMTAAAIADVLAITNTSNPVVASHSTVRTLGDHSSAIPEELIAEIARRHGLFGVILYPHQLSNYASRGLSIELGSMRDVVRAVAHVAKVCGTHECIAIGSDYGGVTSGPKEMTTLDHLEPLRAALLSEFGGDEAIVEEIMAANAIAFLRANWRSGAAG